MKMKYSPRFIIFWAVCRYLTDEQIVQFKEDIVKGTSPHGKRRFLPVLKKHFDLERLLKNPLIREDAYIYNYIQYDAKKGFPRNKLIKKYEKEVIIPLENTSLSVATATHPPL